MSELQFHDFPDMDSLPCYLHCIKVLRISMGTGNITVELFSADILFKVCKYLSCKIKIYD